MKSAVLDEYGSKRVLITGGSGFIGYNLTQKLLKLGTQVTVLCRGTEPKLSFFEEHFGRSTTILLGNIQDADRVATAVEEQELIFNLAGKSGATASMHDPLPDLEVNCRGQLTLLEACRSVNPEARIVFPSSRLVFGAPQYLPVDEDHAAEPLTVHGVHKLAGEKYHLLYHQVHGLPTTVVRISNPYGPGQIDVHSRYSIVNWFIYLAAQGEQIPIYGEGSQRRDYLFIDDLIDALLLAGAAPRAVGEVFNIGQGKGVSLIQMARKIVEAVEHGEIRQRPWPAQAKAIETGDYVTDIAKAKSVLGWAPTTELKAGIRRTVEFYRTVAARNGKG